MPKQKFSLSLKVMIRNEEGRCLLLKRSKSSKNNGGLWDLPGGKLDSGETFDEALLREVAEETGLGVCLDRVVGAAESDLPDRKVAYLILEGSIDTGSICLSDEHDDYAWVSPEKIPAMDLCPQFRRFAERYGSAQR